MIARVRGMKKSYLQRKYIIEWDGVKVEDKACIDVNFRRWHNVKLNDVGFVLCGNGFNAYLWCQEEKGMEIRRISTNLCDSS